MPGASQGSALLLPGATPYPGICLYFAFCHSILNVGEPETLGCGGAGRFNSGPGHRPHFQPWAAGTRYCLFVPPQNPEAKPARLDSSCPGRCCGLWARSPLQVSRLCAESPLFSSIGKVDSTLRPDRMRPGWLPAPSQRWLLFSDASRGPNPPATGTPRPWQGALA